MSFCKKMVADVLHEDGILVIARGLGLHQTVARFVRLYAKNRDHLVFVLNGRAGLYDVYRQLLLAGSKKSVLKNLSFVDANVSQAERIRLYRRGGCIFITSRILVVDLLMRRVDPELVSGLLVLDAHRVSESTTTGFVIRIYRRDNHVGFVKGFSDNPHAFLKGFGKTEKIMRSLFVRKLHLWPRFHLKVSQCFAKCPPRVAEITLPMRPGMALIQKLLLKLIDACVSKVKSSITEADLSDITVEKELSRSFDQHLRQRLDPFWHHITQMQRQLLEDIKLLRKLALALMFVDAVTFMRMVDLVKQSSMKQATKSFWLFIDAADEFFDAVVDRVFRIEGGSSVTPPKLHLQVEQPSKWKQLVDVLQEIRAEITAGNHRMSTDPPVRVLIFVEDSFSKDLVTRLLTTCAEVVVDDHFDSYLMWHHHRTKAHREAVEARQRAGGKAHASRMSRALWHAYDERIGDQPDQSFSESNDDAENTVAQHSTVDYWLGEAKKVGGLDNSFPDWKENIQFVWREQRGKTVALTKAIQNLKEQVDSLESTAPTTSHEVATRDQSRNGCLFFVRMLTHLLSESTEQCSDGHSKGKPPKKKKRQAKTQAEEDDTGLSSSQEWLNACDLLASQKPFVRRSTPNRTPNAKAPPLDGLEIVIQSLEDGLACERETLLHEFAPQYIVIYDTNVEVIRQIEMHQTRSLDWFGASSAAMTLRRVYLLTYKNSVQELLYINSVEAEQQSFRNLINENSRIVLPKQLFPTKAHATTNRDGSALSNSKQSTRAGGFAGPEKREAIVVDMREFRSALPSILHARGLEIIPMTLEVGDYVLSPELCVERKSISDLYGSFKSGRLHTQATVMCRHYRNPILLIEFEEGKKFGFQSSVRLRERVSVGDITSKLVLLTRHFPRLRLFWSASPHATVDFFQCLPKSAAPDPDKAAAVKVSEAEHIEGGTVDIVARDVFGAIPGADAAAMRDVHKHASNGLLSLAW